jgi:Mn-dependent DtxR family transcriptional regulator
MNKPSTSLLRKSGPTPIELEALKAIRSYIRSNRVSPTYKEIGDAINRHGSVARYIVKRLVGKGLLNQDKARVRTIVLTPAGEGIVSKRGPRNLRSK